MIWLAGIGDGVWSQSDKEKSREFLRGL